MNLYNGWLILDKPKGISSNLAVQKIRRLIGKANKVGHAGTLDPLAQGVLPIAIGEATKTVQYLMDAKKEYEFSIFWGQERSTGDAEGEVIADGGRIPEESEIIKILPQFIGQITQIPPIYSALKINGQPAYKLARSGQKVELKARQVIIDELVLTNHNTQEGVTTLRVACGKGTYVRSLAIDIARALSTNGYVSFLKRTKVGIFSINNSITLADEIEKNLLPVTYGLNDILAIEVSGEQAKLLKNGIKISLPEYANRSIEAVQILYEGTLQVIASVNKGICKSTRGFNL